MMVMIVMMITNILNFNTPLQKMTVFGGKKMKQDTIRRLEAESLFRTAFRNVHIHNCYMVIIPIIQQLWLTSIFASFAPMHSNFVIKKKLVTMHTDAHVYQRASYNDVMIMTS